MCKSALPQNSLVFSAPACIFLRLHSSVPPIMQRNGGLAGRLPFWNLSFGAFGIGLSRYISSTRFAGSILSLCIESAGWFNRRINSVSLATILTSSSSLTKSIGIRSCVYKVGNAPSSRENFARPIRSSWGPIRRWTRIFDFEESQMDDVRSFVLILTRNNGSELKTVNDHVVKR